MNEDSLLSLEVTGSCSLEDIEPIRLGLSEEETSARTIDLRILFQQIPKRESQPLRREYPVFKSGLRLRHIGGQRAFENCSESRGCREQPPFEPPCPYTTPSGIRMCRLALALYTGSTVSPLRTSETPSFSPVHGAIPPFPSRRL